MKKPAESNKTMPPASTTGARPRLTLIHGTGPTTSAPDPSPIDLHNSSLRDSIIDRARSRVESGYYQRSEVVCSLVDVLWDEFYSR